MCKFRRVFLLRQPWRPNPMRALALTLCLLATPALADVAGVASVIDGDTLEIHGQRIRFHGIDAPESRQLCRLDGKPWQCGRGAANALAEKIGRRPVTCKELSGHNFGSLGTVIGEGQGNALGGRGLVPNLFQERGVVGQYDHLGAASRHLCDLVNRLTAAESVLAVKR